MNENLLFSSSLIDFILGRFQNLSKQLPESLHSPTQDSSQGGETGPLLHLPLTS